MELGCISVVDISVCIENVHLPSGHNLDHEGEDPLHGSFQLL